MSKRKIAIIGANEAINKLIIKAKEREFETHVFAWKCGDPGETIADFFYPVSIADKEIILSECRKIGVNGVASVTSDFAVNTVNYVARNLGLTCNSVKSDLYARNKYFMRCAFRDAGLYVPWFVKVGKDNNVLHMNDFTYPLIVKPTDRWSSKGVTRVDDIEGLQAAILFAQKESLSGEAIVEGFMEGSEYSCECICYRGEYHVLAFTQKKTTGFPHYIETGHIQPSDIPIQEQPNITNTIYKALEALDIKNGAAHVEFKKLANGDIGIIEIGARMGGDCIGTDLVELSTGYDYLGMVLDLACGEKPDLSKHKYYKKACVDFITTPKDITTYKKRKKDNCVYKEYGISDEFTHEVVDSSTRYGYYIYVEKGE